MTESNDLPKTLLNEFVFNGTIDQSIYFYFDNVEALRIDRDGFHYNGETITDAGKAYETYMSVVGNMGTTTPGTRRR